MCQELFISCHLCCLSAFPHKTAPCGEWNGLYIFTDYVKYEGWLKTSSNTPTWHIITCCVQFNRVLVQQHYRKSKSMPICKCFLHTEIRVTQWKYHIEAVYFKKLCFYERKLHVSWNYSQAIFWFLSHLIGYRLSQHTVSDTACLCCQVS